MHNPIFVAFPECVRDPSAPGRNTPSRFPCLGFIFPSQGGNPPPRKLLCPAALLSRSERTSVTDVPPAVGAISTREGAVDAQRSTSSPSGCSGWQGTGEVCEAMTPKIAQRVEPLPGRFARRHIEPAKGIIFSILFLFRAQRARKRGNILPARTIALDLHTRK